ncbi:MAG: TetR/AcrR family transcriptional regulator C-terminal domain-containing protein [Eubacteriales bacterium]
MSQFTKKAIVASFLNLLHTTPYDQITVKDITDDCGVNRKTFYYYFQDTYVLLEQLLRDGAQAVLSPPELWEENALALAARLYQHKKAVLHVYHADCRSFLEAALYKAVSTALFTYIKGRAAGMRVPEADAELLGRFYAHAVVGIFESWLRQGMKEKPEPAIRTAARMLRGTLDTALANLTDPTPDKAGAANSDK